MGIWTRSSDVGLVREVFWGEEEGGFGIWAFGGLVFGGLGFCVFWGLGFCGFGGLGFLYDMGWEG